MIPYYEADGLTLHMGDCVDVMRAMEPDSVDAIVCDPPYGLRFMGRKWDGLGADAMAQIEWHRLWLAEALRVLKPGAHLLAFSGSRTSHFLAMGLEFAGFRQRGDVSALRDMVLWLYGSGFPKSLDVSKAIDKAAGAEREVVAASGGLHNNRNLNDDGWSKIGADAPTMAGPEAITDAAKQWEGWGTALKPAWEPCVVARKPLVGTVAANVTQYGTGALNVDACRIKAVGKGFVGAILGKEIAMYNSGGRWPANVVLDEEAAARLDEQSGEQGELYGDTGGASRYFYTAKASRSEREAWGRMKLPAERRTDGRKTEHETGHLRTSERVNTHPTVKPLALMEWLIKLVTPPGGLILDPFCGSGSTLVAAKRLSVRAIGIEQDERSVEIARQRIEAQYEVNLL